MQKTWEHFQSFLPNLLGALVIFTVGHFLIKFVMKITDKDLNTKFVDKSIHSFVKSITRILMYVFLLITVLSILKVPMASIITAIGACGVAIGLALQNSLSNVAGGFIILFCGIFKVGDLIEYDSVMGIVDAITIFYTKIHTYDNKTIYIPNGKISAGIVKNYTEQNLRRVDLKIGIEYKENFGRVQKAIIEAINSMELVLKEPEEPFVRISGFSDSCVDVTIRVWCNTENYWTVYFDLYEKIKEKFDKMGIEIPFNQLEVNINNNTNLENSK